MSDPVVHSRRGARQAPSATERVALDREAPERTEQPRRGRPRKAEAATLQGAGSAPANEPLVQEPDRGRTEGEHNITRRSRTQRSVDTFAIPQEWRKRGWDYQFWVASVLGQPVEATTEIFEGGWRPVFWKDVPKPWAPGVSADQQIQRGGQLLFLRPMHLTQEAKQEEYAAAEQQKRDRVQSALEGRVSGQEGIADIKGVRPVPLGLSVEGEVGTQSGHTPRS